MKSPAIFGFSFGVAFLLGGFSALAGTSGSELLDEIIAKPGNWNQMCSSPASISPDVPLPLYSRLAARYFTVSVVNRDRLRERRDDVVPEIVGRLHKFDFSSKVPSPASVSSAPLPSVKDPNELTGLMLEIIEDLDAVETLPELMRLEDDLNTRLMSVTIGDLSAVPLLNLESANGMVLTPGASLETTRNENRVFGSRILQREILSTMATLLRHKKFAPILKTDYEAQYHQFLQHEADNDGTLAAIKTEADIPPNNGGWIWFDPIYHLSAHYTYITPTMPYSAATRQEIRDIVAQFLKQPQDKFSSGSSARK